MTVRNEEPSWQKLEAVESLHLPICRSRLNPQLYVKEPRPSNNYSSLNGIVKKRKGKHHSAKHGQNKGRMWEFVRTLVNVSNRRACPSQQLQPIPRTRTPHKCPKIKVVERRMVRLGKPSIIHRSKAEFERRLNGSFEVRKPF